MQRHLPVPAAHPACGPVRKRVPRSKRLVPLAAFSLALIGAAPEAQAFGLPVKVLGCSMCGAFSGLDFSFLTPLIVAAEVVSLGGGLITGIGSTVSVGLGKHSKGWFVTSYIWGGLNIAASAIWAASTAGTSDAPAWMPAAAFTHGSLAAFNTLLPSIGFARASGPRVAPVPTAGQDAGGRLWAGVALQLYDF